MNVAYNAAFRLSNSIRADLDKFSDAPASASAALQGQIAASLTNLNRAIENYEGLAHRELSQTKKDTAFERVKDFKSQANDYRSQFEDLRKQRQDPSSRSLANGAGAASDVASRRPRQTSTPENPYSTFNGTDSTFRAQNPYAYIPPGAQQAQQTVTRESQALNERSFIDRNNAVLDEYLERGRAVLGELGTQKDMLKGTQKRLYSVATTLGISGDTIRMVERRAKQDKWLFWGCVIAFFGFAFLIIYWLRF